MNEDAVIKLAQEGNREALKLLFEENKKKIFSLAYQYTKNAEDAEDILQEAFIKAYRSLHRFNIKNGNSFSPWLCRIGINCSIDHLRRNKIRKEKDMIVNNMENLTSYDADSNPENTSAQREIREKIDQTLNKLSGQQKIIFILRHYQQLTTGEIAEYLNCSEGSVKRQLFRAVSAMKVHLKGLILENKYEMQKI
ncbi:MAG: sigma-70 family RNA polymerase sigma factor [Candidatus Aminicenantes bacterium]|nr:sigma-70 family RNA polymerase sigma factor [Candidatus Aminicenantes bacterium]